MRSKIRIHMAWALLAALAVAAPSLAQGAELAPLPVAKKQNAARVKLGRYLFFDGRLSGDGGISCASCHIPEKGWADGRPLSEGYPGTLYFRNTQSLMNTSYRKRLFRDGRMSGSDLPTLVRDHLTEAHFMLVDGRLFPERLKQIPEYVAMFKEAYGGEPSFGGTLKAVAAFVKTINSRNVPFDRFLRGDKSALSAAAQRGLALFKGKAGCVKCHSGPLLTDEKFHALGARDNRGMFLNPLRHISYRRFLKTFGVPGYMNVRDDVGFYAVTKDSRDRGKFLTTPLRGVSRTAPYMHGGNFKTLEQVVSFYNRGGGKHRNKSKLLKRLRLSKSERRDLVVFLKSLTGDPVIVKAPKLPDYQIRTLGKN